MTGLHAMLKSNAKALKSLIIKGPSYLPNPKGSQLVPEQHLFAEVFVLPGEICANLRDLGEHNVDLDRGDLASRPHWKTKPCVGCIWNRHRHIMLFFSDVSIKMNYDENVW